MVTLDKEAIRMQVWRLMEARGIARFPKPVFHRIPNFVGAAKAARRLGELPEYRAAKAVFCNPDAPQRLVREMTLRDGKLLVMATPRLKRGFLILDPNTISGNDIPKASTIRGAFKHGRFAEPSAVKVELFVAGSVVVSLDGGRLGKGSGYSDKEYSLLKESGGLSATALVVTTVHDVQIVEQIPQDAWDVRVDMIVTPTKTIRVA